MSGASRKGVTAKCSDAANAERLVALHGGDLRFCAGWGRWLVWDGRRWALDDTQAAKRAALATVRHLLEEAMAEQEAATRALAAKPDSPEPAARLVTARNLVRWAITSQSAPRLKAMLEVASSFKPLVVRHEDLDASEWVLNVANGTVDLRTGRLRPHDRGDLITKIAPVTFEADAGCPTWGAFLAQVMGDDAELVAFLQRVVGYTLTGSTREHILGFFFGTGRNGKTTFLSTLHALLGDYATPAPRGLLFQARGGERHPTELASLFGARFVTCAEIEQGRAFDEALVKDLTGGDPIKARRMREDFWTFVPTHKLFIAGNHKPTVRGDDEGIWRRMRLVPFTVTVPTEKVDKELPEKLRGELPGILAWAVRGCVEWQATGLREPASVREATASYREESDPLAEFLRLRCVLEEGAKVPRSFLRTAYEEFAKENGVRNPLASKAFGASLHARGVTDGGSVRIPQKPSPVDAWDGIRLRRADEPVGSRDLKGRVSGYPKDRASHTGTNPETGPDSPYLPTDQEAAQ